MEHMTGLQAAVDVAFTEKAVMLCKAAVMGDFESYDRVALAGTCLVVEVASKNSLSSRQTLPE